MTHPDLVYTIIPNWNLKDDLGECLQSLLADGDPAHVVVVVDNGSSDGSLEMVADRFPGVRLLRQAENLGYAGALNAGFRHALQNGADYVFGLNNDTVLPPGAVRRLAETARQNPQIGLLSPKVVYYSQPEILFSLGARRYRWLPLPVEYGHRWRDRPWSKRLVDFDYVTGCAMLIPAAVLRQVGLFNTAYFMHYEDNDFCRRVRDAGWRVAMDGRVTILHKAFLSTSRDRSASIRRRSRNGVWFYRAYPHGPARWLTALALLVRAGFKSAGFLLHGQPAYGRAFWEGFVEGWRGPVPAPSGTQIEQAGP